MILVCIYTCKRDARCDKEILSTHWYKRIVKDERYKVLFVHAAPEIDREYVLDGDVLTVRTEESYHNLCMKTYKMIKACLEVSDLEYLIKVDSTLVDYPKIRNGFYIFSERTYFDPKKSLLRDYNGIWMKPVLRRWRKYYQWWIDEYKIENVDFDYLGQFIRKVDYWWAGKCYVVNRNLCEYIVLEGQECAEEFLKYAGGGCEDLMIAKLYDQYRRDLCGGSFMKYSWYILEKKAEKFFRKKSDINWRTHVLGKRSLSGENK